MALAAGAGGEELGQEGEELEVGVDYGYALEEEVGEEGEEEDLPSTAHLSNLRVADLKVLLSARGLNVTGKKDDLIARLDASQGAAAGEEVGQGGEGVEEGQD